MKAKVTIEERMHLVVKGTFNYIIMLYALVQSITITLKVHIPCLKSTLF